MSVRIGINPITWSNDDLPELGGATPLETCLAEAREAGYAGIELGNKFPRRAAALRPILDRHGLALVSGWHSGRLLAHGLAGEIAAIEDHLALLQAMGCEILIFAETTGSIAGARTTKLSRRPRLADGDWAGFGADLTALAEHVAKRGLALAYHHHMGTVVESAAEIDRLMDATGPAVGLLLDTGHLAYAGADPLAVGGSTMSIARTCDLPCSTACGATTRASSTRWSRASSPCRATAPSTTRPCSPFSPGRAIAAGSSSRPSRTRKRRIR
jgi:inosose dehydratase